MTTEKWDKEQHKINASFSKHIKAVEPHWKTKKCQLKY